MFTTVNLPAIPGITGRALRWRRGLVELGALVMLTASLLLIPSQAAHLITGALFGAFIAVHLCSVRRRLRGVLLGARRRLVGRAARRCGADIALVLLAGAMTATGWLQGEGVTTAKAWHSATGMLLLLVVFGHAWRRRRALWVRMGRRA
ncbi:MAG: hypothetical protein ACRDRL_22700 [Sciscionella sp.]